MSDNVVSFNRPGEQTFVLCPCRDGGVPVTPVVVHDRAGPIISALVCPECEHELPVINGIVRTGDEDPA